MRITYFSLWVAVALWGITYIVLHDLLKSMPPSEIVFIRYAIALVMCLLTAKYFRREVHNPEYENKQIRHFGAGLKYAIFAGLCLALATIAQKYGIRITGKPAYSAFITALIALMIPIVKVLIGDTVNIKQLIFPIFLAAIGTLFMMDIRMPTMGDMTLLVCALFYSMQSIAVGKIKGSMHYNTNLIVTCICCIGVAIIMALIFDIDSLVMPVGLFAYFELLFLAFGASYLPWMLIYRAQQDKNVDDFKIGVIYTLEPLFTLAVSFCMGIESLSILELAGAVLIIYANIRILKL